MYQRKTPEDLECGITIAMKVFGAKWKPCLLDAIQRGFRRPSEMHREIKGATPRVLDMQLRELEVSGIVEKCQSAGFPLCTEYTLTDIGRSIMPIIEYMNEWGLQHKELVGEERGAETIVL
ncbi:helix-turn-helix transcriptional regulator [Dyadobacter sp. CY261]|uniref:winged helix-turn-helix transcriptional regulator n=1 Tax=Dyadobacter sp. CY261 TaxID=2907203 RepID=UPI001F1D5A6E|nr:helix-turn-helix domain-containing protein [Dyadobacter sp. CY261]MCF0071224.1 helix-turn-helix transcriptional regulator [Dyadobacter sp. CY261]